MYWVLPIFSRISIISILLFCGMFGAIIIQVVYRYILKSPLTWPYEFSIYCYIYIVFFGAGMAARRNSHIVFELFYERFSKKIRLTISIISNIFIIIILMLILRSSYSFIEFMGDVRSSALGIPFYIVLSSFPLGMALIALYLSLNTLRYFKELYSPGRR